MYFIVSWNSFNMIYEWCESWKSCDIVPLWHISRHLICEAGQIQTQQHVCRCLVCFGTLESHQHHWWYWSIATIGTSQYQHHMNIVTYCNIVINCFDLMIFDVPLWVVKTNQHIYHHPNACHTDHADWSEESHHHWGTKEKPRGGKQPTLCLILPLPHLGSKPIWSSPGGFGEPWILGIGVAQIFWPSCPPPPEQHAMALQEIQNCLWRTSNRATKHELCKSTNPVRNSSTTRKEVVSDSFRLPLSTQDSLKLSPWHCRRLDGNLAPSRPTNVCRTTDGISASCQISVPLTGNQTRSRRTYCRGSWHHTASQSIPIYPNPPGLESVDFWWFSDVFNMAVLELTGIDWQASARRVPAARQRSLRRDHGLGRYHWYPFDIHWYCIWIAYGLHKYGWWAFLWLSQPQKMPGGKRIGCCLAPVVTLRDSFFSTATMDFHAPGLDQWSALPNLDRAKET